MMCMRFGRWLIKQAPRVAGTMWLVVTLFCSLALFFLYLGRSSPQPAGSFGFRGFGVVIGFAFGSVGALLVARQPRNRIGWILYTAGLAACLEDFSHQYAIYALITTDGALPFGELAAWVPSWIFIPGINALAFLLLFFPTDRLTSPRWEPLPWFVAVAVAVAVAGNGFAAGPLHNFQPVINPVAVGPRTLLTAMGRVGLLASLFGVLLAAFSLRQRFRAAHARERQQIKWLAFAGAILALSLVPTFLWLAITRSPAPSGFAALTILAFVTVPVAVAFAILRYRLYDIDRIISRVLAYGVLTVALAFSYASVVLLLGQLLGRKSGVTVAVATLGVAGAFQPVRARVQRAVDSRFNRSRYDAARTMEAFGARLRDEIDLDTLRSELLLVIQETMEPAHASLWLRGPEASR